MLYEIVEHTLIRIKVAQFFFKKRHAKLFWILIRHKRLQLYMCIKLSKNNSDQEYLITSTKTISILNLKIIVVVKNKINILR